jgi:hypothetical protein
VSFSLAVGLNCYGSARWYSCHINIAFWQTRTVDLNIPRQVFRKLHIYLILAHIIWWSQIHYVNHRSSFSLHPPCATRTLKMGGWGSDYDVRPSTDWRNIRLTSADEALVPNLVESRRYNPMTQKPAKTSVQNTESRLFEHPLDGVNAEYLSIHTHFVVLISPIELFDSGLIWW